jgi:hypothetical protein
MEIKALVLSQTINKIRGKWSRLSDDIALYCAALHKDCEVCPFWNDCHCVVEAMEESVNAI